MPEHLRAFVVVIVVAMTVFAVIRKPAIGIIGPERFRLWRAAWVSLTVAVFLIPNFWVFLATATVIVLVVASREPARPAVYLLLVLAAAPAAQTIPGFAGINRLFEVDFQQLAALLLLLPVLLDRTRMSRQSRAPRLPDVLFFLYFALTVALTLRGTTTTDTMRTGFLMFLGMVLPYMVFSRWPRSFGDMRTLAAAFVLPLFVLAVIGVFEMLKGWHLYSAVAANWGGGMTYATRVDALRASGSAGAPIPFGYVFMVAGGFLLLVLGVRPPGRLRFFSLAWIGAGLLSSLSRGPWVGAAALTLAFLATGRGAFQNIVKLGLAGVVVLTLALATPAADRVIGLIPFVGDVEEETISYRQQLFDNSMIVIMRNPVFGSVTYLDTPEMQALFANGIIDVVNSYLRVALNTGLVGLSLFGGFFLFVLLGLWRAIKTLPEEEADLKLAGRALLATLVGILVTIATVSSVGPIPMIYWTVAGLCVAQTRIIRQRVAEIEQQAVQSRQRRYSLAPADSKPAPARVGTRPVPQHSPSIGALHGRSRRQ